MPSLAVAAPIVDPSSLQLELLVLPEVRQSYATYETTSPSDQALPSSVVVVAVNCHLDLHHNLHSLAVAVASEQLLVVVLVEVQAHRSELPLALPGREVDPLEVVPALHEVVDLLVVVLALHVVVDLQVVWLVAWPCGPSSSACSVVETKPEVAVFVQVEPSRAQTEPLGQPPLLLCFLWSAHSSAQPSHFPGAQVNASPQEQLACEASSPPARSPSPPAIH